MANSAQARKRARQAEKHRQHNASQRSTVRTTMKKALNAIESGDKTAAEQALKETSPAIDRLANRGLMHKNKAARHKSRLNKQIRAMG